MTVAVALLFGALTAGWLVPRLLRRIDLRRSEPAPVIAAWLLSMVGIGLAGTTGTLLLLAPQHGPGVLAWALGRCWSAVLHGSAPRFEDLAGVFGGIGLIAVAARAVFVAMAEVRRRRQASAEWLALIRIAARADVSEPNTLWLAYDRPLAFSLAGPRGVIVATEGLHRHLPAGCVAAVLAHERAHLRGRHHLLITAAETLRKTLPFVPLFRHASAALRELVELAADNTAAREHGPRALRTALVRVANQGTPDIALGIARDAVDVRLARLDGTLRPARRARTALSCGTAGVAAATLPFLTGASILLGLATLACPIGA